MKPKSPGRSIGIVRKFSEEIVEENDIQNDTSDEWNKTVGIKNQVSWKIDEEQILQNNHLK